MSALCPATGRAGDCPWLALEASRRARLTGWVGAAAVAAALAWGLGLLASLAASAPAPLAFALTPAAVPATPALAALPDPAPEITSATPAPPAPAVTVPAPRLAAADPRPEALPPAPMADLPAAERLPTLDDTPPPPKPDPAPKTKPKAAKPKAQPAPQISAAQTGVAAGMSSPKTWAAAVVKQIRKTGRKGATSKGVVQIGFTVAADGSLAAVKVVKSSGDAGLDAMGLDHIRRAAPFPAPPQGANRNLAFAFEVK